jgi:HTH-type transcriptional regulator/antitoxin HipB
MQVTPRALGQAVRHTREAHGWTQEELAQKARVSRRWINAFEDGKSSVQFDLVLQVLAVLEMKLEVSLPEIAQHRPSFHNRQKP